MAPTANHQLATTQPPRREATLKFWDATGAAAGSGSAPFALSTRADEPHAGGVAALSYHPSRHLAVTTGAGAGEGECVRVRVGVGEL